MVQRTTADRLRADTGFRSPVRVGWPTARRSRNNRHAPNRPVDKKPRVFSHRARHRRSLVRWSARCRTKAHQHPAPQRQSTQAPPQPLCGRRHRAVPNLPTYLRRSPRLQAQVAAAREVNQRTLDVGTPRRDASRRSPRNLLPMSLEPVPMPQT